MEMAHQMACVDNATYLIVLIAPCQVTGLITPVAPLRQDRGVLSPSFLFGVS
jgi:hypothetical protein